MKPVRELMKDPKVAAGLGGLALLFVVYRVAHMGKPTAAPAADNAAVAAAAPAGGADNGVPGANGAFSVSPGDNASAGAVPRGDVAWGWERNPFIGPPKRGAVLPGGGDEFPTIIVPGFGGKGAPAEPASAPIPAGGSARPGEAVAEAATEALPELRGTVLSGGRGIAIFGTRLVPSGEQVAGWTVERVTAYDVSLRKGDDLRTIGVFRPGTVANEGGKP